MPNRRLFRYFRYLTPPEQSDGADGFDNLPDEFDEADGQKLSPPSEQAKWVFGHSKDHRKDLPQVVIAMAVTRDGVPVRCWTFPGNTAPTTPSRHFRVFAGQTAHRPPKPIMIFGSPARASSSWWSHMLATGLGCRGGGP